MSRRSGRGLALLLGVLALVAGVPARAHDADIVYAQLERADGGVSELMTLTTATLAQLAPVDADGEGAISQQDLDARREAIEAGVWRDCPITAGGDACRLASSGAYLREGYVELRATFSCPDGPMQQTFRILSLLPQGYRVVLSSRVGAGRGEAFAEGRRQIVDVPTGAGGGEEKITSFVGWVETGVFHIFGGADHIAFLLGVLLVGGAWRRVLILVTTFTVAHSITLLAVALDVVPLSYTLQRAVEVAIAVSIVWVAVENLALTSHRHRAVITFGFGLVHGFGFANVLKEYGLGDNVVKGVLGFNLGVEVGQACIVLALFPLVLWLGRVARRGAWAVRIGSAGILAAGGYWVVERVLAFRA